MRLTVGGFEGRSHAGAFDRHAAVMAPGQGQRPGSGHVALGAPRVQPRKERRQGRSRRVQLLTHVQLPARVRVEHASVRGMCRPAGWPPHAPVPWRPLDALAATIGPRRGTFHDDRLLRGNFPDRGDRRERGDGEGGDEAATDDAHRIGSSADCSGEGRATHPPRRSFSSCRAAGVQRSCRRVGWCGWRRSCGGRLTRSGPPRASRRRSPPGRPGRGSRPRPSSPAAGSGRCHRRSHCTAS